MNVMTGNEVIEPVVFSYLKSDLMTETTKRSSYIGKMRGDKEHPDFIDRMSLTEGESFLSDEMLADAIEQVYEWVQAFGRGVENSHVQTADGKVVFTLLPREWWDRQAYTAVDRYIKEAIINYILYRWFEYTNTDEAPNYFEKYEDYARKAQLGMNAEGTKLHTRFNNAIGTPAYTPVDFPQELNYK